MIKSKTSFILLGGCFWRQYPDSWAPIEEPTSECPNLSGVYFDLSREVPYSNDKSVRLTVIFLNMDEPDKEYFSNASAVKIVQDTNDSFEVIAYNSDKVLSRSVFEKTKGEYNCASGMIEIGSKIGSFYEQGGYGIETSKYSFTKGEDGSLILFEKFSAAGFYCILPVAAGGTTWHIFYPKDTMKANLRVHSDAR